MKCFFIMLLIVAALMVCQSQAQDSSRPADFNLIFRYGVDARNILNTFDSTFTRDMIVDSSFVIKLVLTSQELDTIYDLFKMIDFYCYPDTFEPLQATTNAKGERVVLDVSPHPTYVFTIQSGGKIKNLWWDKWTESQSDEAKRLREVIMHIRRTIESKPEYKRLPKPKGHYM